MRREMRLFLPPATNKGIKTMFSRIVEPISCPSPATSVLPLSIQIIPVISTVNPAITLSKTEV